MSELLRALAAPMREPLQQWHPWVVHFPVVLLVLEAIFTICFWSTKRPELSRWSMRALSAALSQCSLHLRRAFTTRVSI